MPVTRKTFSKPLLIHLGLALPSVLGACLLFACTNSKKSGGKDGQTPLSPSENQAVSPRASIEGLLDVSVTVRDIELIIGIKNGPKGSSFECELGNQPISPCYDGAVFKKPIEDGQYILSVDALVDGKRVATGASSTFTITRGVVGTTSEDPTNPLALRFTDPKIRFGMTAPKSKDFVLQFALIRTNACDKAEFRCRLDGPGSFFWTACDQSSPTFTVRSAFIATGPQDISVQARCGDVVGPILNLRWYGVPDNYQDLMLQDLSDGQGRHFIDLVRDLDCPKDKRRFECSTGEGSYSICSNANQITNPPKDLRVRLTCDGREGPPLTLD